MNDRHKCEACTRIISKGIRWNSLMKYGKELCFVCQAIENINKYGEYVAETSNHALMHTYGVTQEMIDTNKKLPYWKNF